MNERSASGGHPLLPIERQIRLAAGLAALGLVVEGVSLAWNSPLSFVLFAAAGPALIGAGTIVYLLALLRRA
ncbi:MAG: hypothetical protein ACREOU_16965 [Candidatus Eiseniibacteriota bacterium]